MISRILRRHPGAISVTGNSEYWTGADEMQNALAEVLPADLRLRSHPALGSERLQGSWMYAVDELLPTFRRTREDTDEHLRRSLLDAIRRILVTYGNQEPDLRFIDKSQSYTVKMSFLSELLRGHEPCFLLVTRNPFAVCQRAATGTLTRLELTRKKRVQLAVQHWDNSMRSALRDGRSVKRFGTVRFEDFLVEPEATLAEIAEVLEMELNPKLLPGPDDDLPLGTPPDNKWYPLRPRVNEKYLNDLPPDVVDAVDERCGDLAERFGYTPEGP